MGLCSLAITLSLSNRARSGVLVTSGCNCKRQSCLIGLGAGVYTLATAVEFTLMMLTLCGGQMTSVPDMSAQKSMPGGLLPSRKAFRAAVVPDPLVYPSHCS